MLNNKKTKLFFDIYMIIEQHYMTTYLSASYKTRVS
jgi:hypothetical protein